MKKIIFYTMGMTYGGTERVIANLANYFCDKYSITIVTNHNEKCYYELDSKVNLINLDKTNKINESFLKKLVTKISNKRTITLKEVIEKINPDIVIAFLPEPSIRLMKLKKYFKNIKFMIAIRNHPSKEFPCSKIIRNYYYKKADKIILQTAAYEEFLPSNFKKKLVIIPNYIELDFNKDIEKL